MQHVSLEHNGGEVDIKESDFAMLTHANHQFSRIETDLLTTQSLSMR